MVSIFVKRSGHIDFFCYSYVLYGQRRLEQKKVCERRLSLEVGNDFGGINSGGQKRLNWCAGCLYCSKPVVWRWIWLGREILWVWEGPVIQGQAGWVISEAWILVVVQEVEERLGRSSGCQTLARSGSWGGYVEVRVQKSPEMDVPDLVGWKSWIWTLLVIIDWVDRAEQQRKLRCKKVRIRYRLELFPKDKQIIHFGIKAQRISITASK